MKIFFVNVNFFVAMILQKLSNEKILEGRSVEFASNDDDYFVGIERFPHPQKRLDIILVLAVLLDGSLNGKYFAYICGRSKFKPERVKAQIGPTRFDYKSYVINKKGSRTETCLWFSLIFPSVLCLRSDFQ